MTDIQKLKALAEAVPLQEVQWYDPDSYGLSRMPALADRNFVSAANPTAVLELIAEIERLRESHQQVCENYNKVSYASEERGKQIVQLKADNEALRKDAERYRFVRNPIARGSSLAIWHEGRMPMFSVIADAAIDSDMSKEAQS